MSRSSSGQQESEGFDKASPNRQYQNFELVWAKVMGFPWWPGKIIGRHDKDTDKYAVIFCLEGTTAYLKSNKIMPFVYGQKPPVNLKTASPDLLKAIKTFNAEYEKAIIFYSGAKQKTKDVKQTKNVPIQIDSDSDAQVENRQKQQRQSWTNAPFEIIYHHREGNELDVATVVNDKKQAEAKKGSLGSDELWFSKWKRDLIGSLVSKGYDRKDAVKTTSKFIKQHYDKLLKTKSLTKGQLKHMKIQQIERLFPN